MSEKIRGTNLWTRFSLLLTYALFLSLWFCQALFLPVESNAAVADLMHNSANPKIGTTKYGTWGTTWNCATCHNDTTTNIKMVVPSIVPPWTTTTRQVVFNKITSTTVTYLGVMGNDERSVLSRSTNICEVCHTKTKFHQYSSNSVTTPVANATHKNRADCTQTCHPHSAGFAISVTGCTACHGNPPATTAELTTNAFTYAGVPGAHVKHSSYAPAIACITCHQGTNITMASGDNKVNLGFQINKANWPQYSPPANSTAASAVVVNSNYTNWQVAAPTTSTTAANTMTCSVYCHAGWTGAGGAQNPVSWATTGPLACNSCHYSTQTEVNTAGASAPGSHYKHAASTQQNYACTACHGATLPTTTAHVNGDSKVTFTAGGKYKGFPNFTSASAKSSGVAYGTCTATACHGQNSPAAWGTAVNPTSGNVCQKCHGSLTAAFNNFSSPTIAPGYGTDGRDTGGNTAATAARVGAHQSHLTAADGITDKIHCGSCHTVVTSVPTHLNYTTATITFNGLATTRSHTNASVSRVSGIVQCSNTYCHSVTSNSGALAGGTTQTPGWNSSTYLTGTINDCKQCHGFPPPTAAGHPTVASVPSSFPIGSSCNCHDNLSTTATTTATIFNDKTKHINGIIEGGDCVSCHTIAQGSRAPIVGQFASQSHHVQRPGGITKADCYQCHMEAKDTSGSPDPLYHVGVVNSGAAVNLVVWANGTNGTRGTTYLSYTANGKRSSIAKLNTHCLSCHNSANAAFIPFGDTYRTDQYSPEARLATPKAKTSILSRYSSTRTVPWSIYNYSSASGGMSRFGTNQKNRTTKALSAHGNASKNQMPAWSATANGPGEDGNMTDYTYSGIGKNRNVFCYDCHNSHGSSASGITSSYSSATGRYKGGMLKTTTAGIGGYNKTYAPVARTTSYKNYSTTTRTTATFNTGASLCNDCHNDNATAWKNVNNNKPWNILTTYSSARSIVGYWSTPYFDNYTVSQVKRTPYKGGGSTGIKNMTEPMGGHYGSSINATQAGHTGEINGLCTPCHDPHGVSNALGADRDHGIPLLKGTWVTSPYREDKADKFVKRGGGSKFAGMTNMGPVPGYHVDQNTFMRTPAPYNGGAATTTAKGNLRRQAFRSFSILSSAQTGTNMPNLAPATFAGLCLECHNQTTLTGAATNTTVKGWRTKERVHQSVSGWASTNGTNVSNKVHAYTCAKCHAPHVSRLPRLLVTNCLDQRHIGQNVSAGINSVSGGTTTPGNINQSTLTSSALGAGRFPGGGSRYSGTPGSAQNPGGWWFQTNGAAGTTQPGSASYGSNCHNAAGAGGATYKPVEQRWNKYSPW